VRRIECPDRPRGHRLVPRPLAELSARSAGCWAASSGTPSPPHRAPVPARGAGEEKQGKAGQLGRAGRRTRDTLASGAARERSRWHHGDLRGSPPRRRPEGVCSNLRRPHHRVPPQADRRRRSRRRRRRHRSPWWRCFSDAAVEKGAVGASVILRDASEARGRGRRRGARTYVAQAGGRDAEEARRRTSSAAQKAIIERPRRLARRRQVAICQIDLSAVRWSDLDFQRKWGRAEQWFRLQFPKEGEPR
jgi:hypothetical protein